MKHKCVRLEVKIPIVNSTLILLKSVYNALFIIRRIDGFETGHKLSDFYDVKIHLNFVLV